MNNSCGGNRQSMPRRGSTDTNPSFCVNNEMWSRCSRVRNHEYRFGSGTGSSLFNGESAPRGGGADADEVVSGRAAALRFAVNSKNTCFIYLRGIRINKAGGSRRDWHIYPQKDAGVCIKSHRPRLKTIRVSNTLVGIVGKRAIIKEKRAVQRRGGTGIVSRGYGENAFRFSCGGGGYHKRACGVGGNGGSRFAEILYGKAV